MSMWPTQFEYERASSVDDAIAKLSGDTKVIAGGHSLIQITVNQRTAFVLRYFEQMSPTEIAGVLGCREGTVRTHIQRCLVALRARLTNNSITRGSEE